VAHQRLLADQARENFYALKEQQRISRGRPAIARQTPPTPPVEKRGIFSDLFEKPATAANTTVYEQRRTTAPVKPPKLVKFVPPTPTRAKDEEKSRVQIAWLKPAKPVATTPAPTKRTAFVKPPKAAKPVAATPAPTKRTALLAKDEGRRMKDEEKSRAQGARVKPAKPIATTPAPTKRTAFVKPPKAAKPVAATPAPTKRTAFVKPPKAAKPVATTPASTKRTAFVKPPKAAKPVAKAPKPTQSTAFLAEDGGIVIKDGVRGRWVKVAQPVKPIAKAPAQTKRTGSSKPLASGQPANSESLFKPSESARLAKNKRSDETVFYHGGRNAPEPNTPRYRAYKRKYAQSLGKTPEALTRKERERALTNYRN
jgi:hypothetical protein